MKRIEGKKRLYSVYLPIILLMATGVIGATVGPVELWVAVTTGNTGPVIYNVTPVLVTPTAASQTDVVVIFNVSDADGVANLDDSSVKMNLSLGNYVDRQNMTGNCATVVSSFNGGTDRTYNCTVTLEYFDNASSDWTINISVLDQSGAGYYNDSETFTVNSLSAFNIRANSLVLSGSLGTTDNELSFVLNNTGNFDFSVVNVTPYALNASLTDFFMLGGGNFTLNGTQDGSGNGLGLENATGVNISADVTDTALSIQLNKSNADGSGGSHPAYIYVDIPNDKGLSSGVTYNSSLAWDVWAS